MSQIQGITTESDSHRKAWHLLVRWFWIPLALALLVALLWDIPILSQPPLPAGVGNSRTIGKITQTENEVRMQGPSDVAWELAPFPSSLTSGSRILTLENAGANIELDQVGEIQIHENSLVVIEEPMSQAQVPFIGKLKLLRGNLKFHLKDSAAPLSIQLGATSPVQIQPGAEIQIQADSKTGEARLTVIQGEVRAPEASSAPITSGQSLEWSGKLESRPVILSPSASPAVPKTPTTPKPKALPAPKLKQPKFRPSLKPAEKSTSHWDLFLNVFASIALISDASAQDTNADTKVETPFQELDIELEWEAVPGAKFYRVQIARERSFKTILYDEKSDSANLTWHYKPGMENSKGRVFYRVSSYARAEDVAEFSAPGILWIPKPAKEPETQIAAVSTTTPTTVKSETSLPSSTRPFWSSHERQKFFFELGVSALSESQSTKTLTLTEVDGAKPFVHEWLRVRFLPLQKWEASLEWRFNRWKSDSSAHTAQKDLTSFTSQLRALKTVNEHYSLGGSISQSYRFEKATLTTIGTEMGISLGPVLKWRSQTLDASLYAPVAGLLIDSYYGLEARVSRPISFGDFFVIPELGASITKWKTPESTEVRQWFLAASLGLAL